jgi:hypothetical protein
MNVKRPRLLAKKLKLSLAFSRKACPAKQRSFAK